MIRERIIIVVNNRLKEGYKIDNNFLKTETNILKLN